MKSIKEPKREKRQLKKPLNKLKRLMVGIDPTTWMLKQYKESWTDKRRYKKIKL